LVRGIGIAAGQGYLIGRPAADTSLMSVDLSIIEAGGLVLERRVRPPTEPAAAPTS